MNKQQRTLTIVALIIFLVIGASHYLAWPPLIFHQHEKMGWKTERWDELTWNQAKARNRAPNDYWKVFFFDYLTAEQFAEAERGFPPEDVKAWVPTETETWRTAWKPYLSIADSDKAPIIRDIRMPWFILGVSYAAMFFILSKPRERRVQ